MYVPQTPLFSIFRITIKRESAALSAANCNNHRQDSPHAHSWVSGYSPWDILGTGTNRLKQDRQLRTDYAETMVHVHFFSGRAPRPLSSARSLLAFSLEHCQDPYAGTWAVRKWANGRSRVSVYMYPCGTVTVTRRGGARNMWRASRPGRQNDPARAGRGA
jgi:hypothetical protein